MKRIVIYMALFIYTPLHTETTESTSIIINISEGSGISYLGVIGPDIKLSPERVYDSIIPGEKPSYRSIPDTITGTRLIYTVYGQSSPMNITVRSLMEIPLGLLEVEVLSRAEDNFGNPVTGPIKISNEPSILIQGIKNCSTGTTINSGLLLKYTLKDVINIDEIKIEYELVPG